MILNDQSFVKGHLVTIATKPFSIRTISFRENGILSSIYVGTLGKGSLTYAVAKCLRFSAK